MPMKNVVSRVGGAWCRLTHPTPMWPVQGYYRCPKCLRSFPVPWERPLPVKRQNLARRDVTAAQPRIAQAA